MARLKLPDELYHHVSIGGRQISYCTMRQQVLHCIGITDCSSKSNAPYKRHGKTFYRPWRNYFCARPDDKTWIALCAEGYAAHKFIEDNMCIFWLTRAGLDWLGEQLNMTIYDEGR